MTSRTAGTPRRSSNRAPYRHAFVRDVHRVLSLGYRHLCNTEKAVALQAKQEPAITGLLVKAMKEVRHQAHCHYFDIDDDPRLNDGEKEGRDREQIDIQVTRLASRPEAELRFHFEAKRLYRSDSVSEYMGDKGLKALLTEYYAKGDDHAGMLGYVQQGTPHEWAEKIREKLDTDRNGYGLTPNDACWLKRDDESALDDSYSSHHPNCSRPITVHHTFLMCHG